MKKIVFAVVLSLVSLSAQADTILSETILKSVTGEAAKVLMTSAEEDRSAFKNVFKDAFGRTVFKQVLLYMNTETILETENTAVLSTNLTKCVELSLTSNVDCQIVRRIYQVWRDNR